MPRKATTKKPTAKVTKRAVKKVPKKKVTKTTKRTVAKKKVTNKRVSKKVKVLVCAPDEKCFWTTDGQVLKNLDELQLAFGTMDDEVYLHHVTKEKNDFAEWVEHVLQDKDCATDLRRSKKPTSAKTVVVRYLRHYHA